MCFVCYCFKDQNFLWLNELAGAFDPALIKAFYPGGVQGKNSVQWVKEPI